MEVNEGVGSNIELDDELVEGVEEVDAVDAVDGGVVVAFILV